MYIQTNDIHSRFEVVRNELKTQGAMVEMTEAARPTTDVWNTNGASPGTGKILPFDQGCFGKSSEEFAIRIEVDVPFSLRSVLLQALHTGTAEA